MKVKAKLKSTQKSGIFWSLNFNGQKIFSNSRFIEFDPEDFSNIPTMIDMNEYSKISLKPNR